MTTETLTTDISQKTTGTRIAGFLGKYGALVALGVLLVIFTVLAPQFFLTPNNLLQVLNQSALVAIVACGLTLVLAANQFDLSIGNGASLAGVTVCVAMLSGIPLWLSIIIAVASGALVGFINGILVTKVGINALVATMGTGSVLVGINYFISGGTPQPVTSTHPEFLSLAIGNWFGIPRPIYYMVAVGVLLWVVLNKTDLGRGIRAVGGNEEAARLSGVRIAKMTTITFVLSGTFAAVTGVLLASTIGSGQPTAGDNYTMAAFAAVFLGSTVLREGQFHIIGTLVGVVTVAVGFNGLALVNVPSFVQFLFQGLLLIMAVSFSSVARRLIRGH